MPEELAATAAPEHALESTSQLATELEQIQHEVEVASGHEAASRPDAAATEPLKIHLVNEQAVVDARVHQMAEQGLQDRLAAHKGLRGVATKIWSGNIGRDYQLMKRSHESREAVRKDHSLVLGKGVDRAEFTAQLQHDVDRFTSEYDLVDKHEGETSEQLQATPKGEKAAAAIKDLVRKSVSGELDDDAFAEERTRVLNELSDKKLIDKADLYADNIKFIADQVGERVKQGQNLDRILEQTQVYLDTSKMGVRTEAHFNGVEKLHAKLMDTHLSALMGEAKIAAGVSAAYSIAKWSTRRATSTALRVGAVGLGTGVFAGLREHNRLKVERSVDMRERAEGATFDDKAERRGEFEKYAYDMKPAMELYGALKDMMVTTNPDGVAEGKVLDKASFQDLMMQVADIDARRNSGRTGIDLISYSGASSVASERKALYMLTAIAKTEIARLAEENPDWVPKVASPTHIGGKRQLSDVARSETEARTHVELSLKALTETMRAKHDSEVSDKDTLYKKFSRREVGKAAVKSALIGVTIGLAVQEVSSAVSKTHDGVLDGAYRQGKGLFEAHRPANLGENAKELRSTLAGHLEPKVADHHVPLGNGNTLKVPAGIHTVKEPNGTYNVVRGKDVLAKDIHFGKHGTLDKASIHRLHQAGIKTTSHTTALHHSVEHSGEVSDKKFVQDHLGEMKRVHREVWYDNDTSGVYDKNELRMHWGGTNGMDAKGNYAFTTAAMTDGGSYHDGLSANAHELAKQGKLQILLSVSRGTQQHVFAVPVDARGNAIIAAHSAAGKALFEQHNGVAQFKGAFAEVAQLTGTNADGSERVRLLSTDLGKGLSNVHDTFKTEQLSYRTTTTLNVPTVNTHVVPTVIPRSVPLATDNARVFVPPVLPVVARGGLERARGNEPQTAEFVPGTRNSANIAELTRPLTAAELEQRRGGATESIPAPPSTQPPIQSFPSTPPPSEMAPPPAGPELESAPARRELEGARTSGEVVARTQGDVVLPEAREQRQYTAVTEVGADGQPVTVYTNPALDNLRPAQTPAVPAPTVTQVTGSGQASVIPADQAIRPEPNVIQTSQDGTAEVVPANVAREPRADSSETQGAATRRVITRSTDVHSRIKVTSRAPRPALRGEDSYAEAVENVINGPSAPASGRRPSRVAARVREVLTDSQPTPVGQSSAVRGSRPVTAANIGADTTREQAVRPRAQTGASVTSTTLPSAERGARVTTANRVVEPAPTRKPRRATRPAGSPARLPVTAETAPAKAPAAAKPRPTRAKAPRETAAMADRRDPARIAAEMKKLLHDKITAPDRNARWKSEIWTLNRAELAAFVDAGIKANLWDEQVVQRHTKDGKRGAVKNIMTLVAKPGDLTAKEVLKEVVKTQAREKLDARVEKVPEIAAKLKTAKTLAGLLKLRQEMTTAGLIGMKVTMIGKQPTYEAFPRRYEGMPALYKAYIEKQLELSKQRKKTPGKRIWSPDTEQELQQI